jgi:hypothetical protein
VGAKTDQIMMELALHDLDRARRGPQRFRAWGSGHRCTHMDKHDHSMGDQHVDKTLALMLQSAEGRVRRAQRGDPMSLSLNIYNGDDEDNKYYNHS